MSVEDNYNETFVARLASREKQMQQHYRPVISVHKWFARRPGSLFRALALAEFAEGRVDSNFRLGHSLSGVCLDPFMGGGTRYSRELDSAWRPSATTRIRWLVGWSSGSSKTSTPTRSETPASASLPMSKLNSRPTTRRRARPAACSRCALLPLASSPPLRLRGRPPAPRRHDARVHRPEAAPRRSSSLPALSSAGRGQGRTAPEEVPQLRRQLRGGSRPRRQRVCL